MTLDIAQEFPLDTSIAYLNHAAVAPWPKRAEAALSAFARENVHEGARHYPRWLDVELRLRRQLAQLINAPSTQDIALVKNTSEALSMVAWGLTWEDGDEVIISDQEFPSNRIVWESLHSAGVKVVVAELNNEAPEAAIEACFSPRTRLVSISSVQYGTGLRLDLQRLGTACRERGILFCVDAIQSIGAEPLDVQTLPIDFTMADGHKWMLGAEGLGLFYVRPDLRDRLRLFEYGWHMVKHRGDFDRKDWEPADSATRFECGSPNMLGIYTLQASTSLLLEVGLPQVRTSIAERIRWLEALLTPLPGYRQITPTAAERRAGIFTFRIEGQDSPALYQALMREGVVCAYRGGGVRFSPHFYTPEAVIERAVETLKTLIG